ncbi:MAG: sugar phosphate isomerase/epimerase [Clostridia bacterium]|nr:sugar phosphate isomerase/epimerase [Clostridia bacterium]
MNKIGLCSVTFRGKPAEEVIEIAKKNGLDCIEWGGDIHVPYGDTQIAARVGEATRKSGLECNSYGSYFRCDSLENFKPVSQAAKALGATVIRVWAGEKDSEKFSDEEFNRLVETVVECADYAKKFGQKIAFEYHYGTYCNNSESVVKLLDAVRKENVGTYWQPAYWLGDMGDSERIAKNLAAIEIIKERLINVHVYQWRGFERFPLSAGEEEWALYMKRLPSHCNCLLEFVKDDEVQNFEEDIKTLKNLVRSK